MLGVSALVVAVVVFVAIGTAVGLLFLTQPSAPAHLTTTTSATTSSTGGTLPPSTSVKTAVDQWLLDFNSRNVSGMVNFYSQDSTVVWSGDASGLAGTYSTRGNVEILYGSSIGKTLILNASITNYAEKAANPDNINVTMTILMNGNSSVVGTLNAVVAVSQQWEYSGGAWQILKENWNYQTFTVEFPVSATTFPQWGALKTGQNPNLVSEKSLEWHAGPWVAASVYAAIFAVLAIGVIKYRGRSRVAPSREKSLSVSGVFSTNRFSTLLADVLPNGWTLAQSCASEPTISGPPLDC